MYTAHCLFNSSIFPPSLILTSIHLTLPHHLPPMMLAETCARADGKQNSIVSSITNLRPLDDHLEAQRRLSAPDFGPTAANQFAFILGPSRAHKAGAGRQFTTPDESPSVSK